MKYRHLFILLTTAAFLFACNGQEDPQPGPEPEDTSAVSLSLKSLDLAPDEGSTVSVDVITEDAWTLEGMSEGVREWLAADVESGNGNSTITFSSLGFNPYNETRMAVLTVRSGKASASVVIKQANDPTRVIKLSAEALAFTGAVGEELTVDVETTKPWVLEGYTDEMKEWISIEPVSGETNASVTLKTLSANMDLADRVASLGFRIDRVHCAGLEVSQATGITIEAAETELSFPSDTPTSKQVVITTTTDKYPWHVDGLTDEVKTWLSVTPESAAGLTSTVTISTLNANEGASPRTATLTFAFTETLGCSITISQAPPVLETFVITWKGSGSYKPLIKGSDSSPHTSVPWLDGSTTLSSFPSFLNGKGGEVVSTGGNYTNTATWLFKDNITGEWIPLEMGPARATASNTARVYYHNHGNDNLRWCGTYIKIPAKEGFKLTHVYINSFNGASLNCLTLSTDKLATQAVEGYSKVKWGKNDIFDKELTETQEGVDYYLSTNSDRWVDSFTFTYTEVR